MTGAKYQVLNATRFLLNPTNLAEVRRPRSGARSQSPAFDCIATLKKSMVPPERRNS